jgi:hypothetical protein
MPELYKSDRLYCTACREQPASFREVVHWQINVVSPHGELLYTDDGQVDYECPQCRGKASWGHELNP